MASELAARLFHVYRDWCRAHPALFEQTAARAIDPPAIPPDIAAQVRELAVDAHELRASFLRSVARDDALELLWLLHEKRDVDGRARAIYAAMPALEPLETIRRGALNLFKRFSWTLHLLAASQMLWDGLPNAELPAGLTRPDVADVLARLREEYRQIAPHDLALMRIGCLLHDIGVRDGVEDHPAKGVKYVAEALEPVGGAAEVSRVTGGVYDPDECLLILQAFVSEHTLPSKVNGELGPMRIRGDFLRWMLKTPADSASRHFFERAFPRLMSLFVACDIFAVSDEQVSAYSYGRLLHAIRFLETVAAYPDRELHASIDDGLERIAVIVGADEDTAMVRAAASELLGRDAEAVLHDVADADAFDFAMAAMKPMEMPREAAAVLLWSVRAWRTSRRDGRVDTFFSPHCDTHALRRWARMLIDDALDVDAGLASARECGVNVDMDARTLSVTTVRTQA